MSKIVIKNARISFPSLFHKASFQGQETKYESTFLIPKSDSVIAQIKGEIAKLIKENLKGKKLGADKICLKDGDEIDYDGYKDHYSIKASNDKRPLVINKDKSPLTEDDNVIYSGCRVNLSLELWAQDNGWGQRINAKLLGVQFAADDTPFGDGGSSASVDDFEAISEEEDIPF
jgi:hypothetical protein